MLPSRYTRLNMSVSGFVGAESSDTVAPTPKVDTTDAQVAAQQDATEVQQRQQYVLFGLGACLCVIGIVIIGIRETVQTQYDHPVPSPDGPVTYITGSNEEREALLISSCVFFGLAGLMWIVCAIMLWMSGGSEVGPGK